MRKTFIKKYLKKIYNMIVLIILSINIAIPISGCSMVTNEDNRNKSNGSSENITPDNSNDDTLNKDTANEDDSNNISKSTEPVSAGINVSCIEGLSDEFIHGVDISTIKVEYESGVKYYDFEGNELTYEKQEDKKGFFDFLKECGINWVRIRVWNNPYDEEGNGYGGGNNDVDTAIEIGKFASDSGLRCLIDFHYSDFWADPNKYQAPKEWADMDMKEKAEALEVFTAESLTKLVDSGVDVGMVQIGNETVNGLAGETDWDNICMLMKVGSRAIHYVADNEQQEIMVALHFTDISEEKYDTIAATLQENQVYYDVFATSYYPFWHGTTKNLNSVMKMIAEKYDKKVMVAETSYVYTLKDGDGHGQSVDKGDNTESYEVSVQGQADAVADVIKAMADIGEAGIGVFYWEPAWIPVGIYNKNSDNADEVLNKNKRIWEEKGSGWASSYAGSYDALDAGKYYGGSSWDNQALFDFKGHPLESINVFKYVYTGAKCEK